MKYFFFILFLSFQSQLLGQNEIEVPHFRSVQIDYDLKDYVSVSIDKNGGLFVENDSIALTDLRKSLFTIIKEKAKYNDLGLSIMIIELVVDKNLVYQKLENILYEFPKLGILKIHFVCNSKDKIRFKKVCTTGFLFRMNSLDNNNNNNNSVLNEVRDSLKNEMIEYLKKTNQDINGHTSSRIPPPPPPPNLTASQLRNQSKTSSLKIIEISPKGFKVDNIIYSKKELTLKIKEWSKAKPTSYILSPTNKCTYEDLLFPLAELKTSLMELWIEESKNLFNQDYFELDYQQRREVRNKFPFRLVFDEPK